MITDNELYVLSARLGAALKMNNKFITCAESCTGGWVAKTITDAPGSADWFERGFVTYGNQAKIDLLGVCPQILEQNGSVSKPVVQEMACGALHRAYAGYAVAISGIAGPGGGTFEKPVGMVWFGFVVAKGDRFSHLMYFNGNRDTVRRKAVHFALTTMFDVVQKYV